VRLRLTKPAENQLWAEVVVNKDGSGRMRGGARVSGVVPDAA